ncbi:Hypothetical protein, putative [Bodo saltans]|nr:Hypothetical protein, putative [Bodo saltans]|eukprot:CUF84110.1 Hypothetical protein, putative [Bodo saltans]
MVKLGLIAVVALLLIAFAHAVDDCVASLACRPWNQHVPCTSGASMDLRFVIDTWEGSTNDAYSNGQVAFCPLVDANQAFVLDGVSDYIDGAFLNGNASSTFNNTNIYVYGQGSLDSSANPQSDGSGALFSYIFPSAGGDAPQFGSGCGDGELAVVSFLMINFTMTNGAYLYQHNGTEIGGNPINSGWVSTCDSGNKCLFGDPACIGMGNVMNCAKCYNQASLDQVSTRVWAAYYGTDASGKTYISGQDNPLNFLQYASGSAYIDIANNL